MISSEIVTTGHFLAGGCYAPASVQRSYQWGADETGTLLEDLLRAWRAAQPGAEGPASLVDSPATSLEEDDDPSAALRLPPDSQDGQVPDYFLGAVVLQAGEGDRFDIYDGLQRTVSLTILFCVARDLLAAADGACADLRETLHGCVAVGDRQPRLVLAARERALAELVIPRGEAIRQRRGARHGAQLRIVDAAKLFREQLSGMATDDIAAFMRFVLSHVLVCRVLTSSSSLARQIFVTTNDRGMRLNQADVLKSQIASVAQTDEAADQILEKWARIEKQCGRDGEFEAFLRTVSVLARMEWPGAQGLTELGDHVVRGFNDRRLLAWLDDLDTCLGSWKRLMSVRHPDMKDPFGGNLRRLHVFAWEEWRPLALLYLDRYRKALAVDSLLGVRLIESRLALLQRRCMAFTLAGVDEHSRRKFFLSALRVERRKQPGNPFLSGNPLSLRDTQKARIRQLLDGPVTDPRTYLALIRWYEMLLWEDNPPSHVLAGTTEHVLPQTPSPDSRWIADFPDESARRNAAYAIGNLALMTWDDNSDAGRLDFDQKKLVYGQSAMPFRTLDEVRAAPAWTPEEVARRSRAMAERIISELEVGR